MANTLLVVKRKRCKNNKNKHTSQQTYKINKAINVYI